MVSESGTAKVTSPASPPSPPEPPKERVAEPATDASPEAEAELVTDPAAPPPPPTD